MLASRAYWHERKLEEFYEERARQATQHPGPTMGRRGDHYRRRNNGMALRTYRAIFHRGAI